MDKDNLIKHTVTAPQLDGELIYKYDLDGILRVFENNSLQLSENMLRFLAVRSPMIEGWLPKMQESFQREFGIKLHVQKIDIDLSFDSFWNFYGYKIGGPDESKKLWNGIKKLKDGSAIKEADKIMIFRTLPRFKVFTDQKRTALPYPATYLRNRRWLDSF